MRVPDEKIAALLKGEQLVPPLPLPPEVFATREVEQVRPALKDASRDWNLLDTDFRTRLLLVYKIMREQHGYEMALLEGYRSPERQNRLAQMGSNVTNAAAFQSYHQYGLAADNAFLRDGKLVISEKRSVGHARLSVVRTSRRRGRLDLGWPMENDGPRTRRIP
ncbi:D-alanyl-D-alanine carboxypeptidase family protein [Burkholderia mallei]|nr:D-alanyl-D-alanine carboxypeptidase family protein [Burkholderia mallei]